MTVYLPRRFLLAAVSAAVLLLLGGLLLFSDSGGDGGPAAALAGGVTTLTTAKPHLPNLRTTTTALPATTAVADPPTTVTDVPVTDAPTTTARRRTTTTGAPATTAVPPVTAAATTSPPPPTTVLTIPQSLTSYGSLASAVVAAHNRERAAWGLPPLQRSSCLDAIAGAWAAQIALVGRLIHNPNSSDAVGACMLWHSAGENIGYDGTIEDLEDAWMASAVHQANILDPAFTQVGVGVVEGPDGLLYVVVNFAG